ncbi:MAG: hypothetical protein KFB94_02285 [Methylophilaceae bacterium]|nr:MAG: hypothetical protein KFB94_02285 [Methylophilaceae bacterium]
MNLTNSYASSGTTLLSEEHDPEHPDAASVMASLLYVSTIYNKKPSQDFAKLALRLAEKLMTPEYAESELICTVSRRMCVHWTRIMNEYEHQARQ